MGIKQRKILSLFLAAVTAFSVLLFGVVASFAETSGDYEYSVISAYKKTCAITNYSGSETEIFIPSRLDEYTVIRIGEWAFDECTSLTSIIIPDGITEIGNYAFYGCSSLLSIEIPDSVTKIGDGALDRCDNLISARIPESVTNIGDYAFGRCYSLTSVEIPDSVTEIGDFAFYDCISLSNITIPDSVTVIGRDAFYGCTSITNITIPDSVTKIPYCAFRGCTSLKSVEIPSSVTEIEYDAFGECNLLTIYGYNNSYAQTYAEENSIPFVDLDASLDIQYSKAQIRFQGIGAQKDKSQYQGKFDVRTVAKISQENFISAFGSDDNAIENITDIGFVYAANSKVRDFDFATAKTVAQGGKAKNYVKKSVNYIQHAGEGEDYIFTCLISDISDDYKTDGVTCLAFVCYGGACYCFDKVEKVSYNDLYTAYMPD